MVISTVIIVLCLVAFAAIHSFMASLKFKRAIIKALGPRAEKLYLPVYSLIAVLMILPVVYLLYRYPGQVLYVVPYPWFWLMVTGQAIAAVIAPRAFMDAPQRFRILSQLSVSGTPEAGELKIRGIYRWVRDPFLLSGLVILWLTPFMTVNLLVLYIFASIYLYIGSLHWESRLVSQFGDKYIQYQKEVRRIIPGRGYKGDVSNF
ncbi:conserved hypothetical protein [Methanosalsum zhilinae DSM 4017]|uniref:NnrU domain-containing protein n=1 Tax=Methanosalsum zhilinae (strain DSM 4017 / NBRC 107636 / OCM 62 / WeN5) TaxID=679901 RepID=F7XMN9_METZD|nr:isoprenylcysteine carboxylmethyltransferase family protein [Methanosalsum zhilinae]AEH61054.1 conserved hypothetical protein [Methanosalsum zhilinae DSM 4017]